ncbi:MAG: hypothetical protein GXO74_10750 [Calditrichaeota bacterium]|nr:hypothetical protein [Calditrichota bacterium]
MRIGCDAITLGERDFWQRVEFLTTMQKKYNLPFVSANIYQPGGQELLFKPYIIKTLKGAKINGKNAPDLRVGIFGVVFKRLQIVVDQKEPQLVVTDPIEAAKKVVAEIRDKCDVIVALAHIRYPQMKMLAETVPGIDVIIGCHDPIYKPEIQKYGNSVAILGGNRGQQIGDIRIDFNKRKEIIKRTGKVVTLDKKIAADPDMQKLVSEFKTMKARQQTKKAASQSH